MEHGFARVNSGWTAGTGDTMLAVPDDAVHQIIGPVADSQLSEFKATLVVCPVSVDGSPLCLKACLNRVLAIGQTHPFYIENYLWVLRSGDLTKSRGREARCFLCPTVIVAH